jgi:hypothetical protein|tara:strand:- start:178 stop:477 length:300 start_codon:yes stop_codon:yes gene_type:complete
MDHLDYKSPKELISAVETNKQFGAIAKKYWETLEDEITYLVKSIDKKPKLYQNNYGHYMGALNSLKKSGLPLSLGSYLLIKGGGNHIGILDALKIMTGA